MSNFNNFQINYTGKLGLTSPNYFAEKLYIYICAIFILDLGWALKQAAGISEFNGEHKFYLKKKIN